VTLPVLREMVAYNVHQAKSAQRTGAGTGTGTGTGTGQAFEIHPNPGPRTDDVLTMPGALEAVQCIAFAQQVLEGGHEAMDGVIDGLTVFMRERGSIEPNKCEWCDWA
jgi:hypothetical protein